MRIGGSMGKASQRKLIVCSDLEQVPKVQRQIMEEATANGFSEKAVFAIRLALDEALCNAMKHGNHLDPQKRVTVTYSVDKDCIEIAICDEGPGFIPAEVPDPTQETHLSLPHGRGVMLMRKYMTHVRFNDKGNCVYLIKTIGCNRPE